MSRRHRRWLGGEEQPGPTGRLCAERIRLWVCVGSAAVLAWAMFIPVSADARSSCNSFQYNNFNVCTFNSLDGAGNEIPFTSTETVAREVQISSGSYTVEPGEKPRAGCVFPTRIAWGGKTSWVRFLSGAAGSATVTVDPASGFDVVLAVWRSPNLEPTSFGDLIHLGCKDGFSGGGIEQDTNRVNANEPIHIQVRGFCADQTVTLGTPNPDTCSNYDTDPPTDSGVATVAVNFACDNRDGDTACDTFDACPTIVGTESNGCPPTDFDHDNDGVNGSPGPDCNDNDRNIRPGAAETVNNNVDENCDAVLEFDRDGDGARVFVRAGGVGISRTGADCDDANPSVRPGAPRVPGNGLDDDCDGRPEPFPTVTAEVTLSFRDTRRGISVRSLVLRNVTGRARVEVTCRRKRTRACGRQVRTALLGEIPARAAGKVSFRRLRGARLRAGTVVEIRVTKPHHIGRYIRYKVRRAGFKKSESRMNAGSRRPCHGRRCVTAAK